MFLITFLFFLKPIFANAVTVGRVVSVIGKVLVDNQEIEEGFILKENQVIRTDFESSCKLFLIDQSVIDIQPKSEFKVEKVAQNDRDIDIQTQLNLGGLRASIHKKLDKKSRFHIKTKTSVLAVRGTELLVSLEDKGNAEVKERVVVSNGLVERNGFNGDSQMIEKGHALVQSFSFNNQEWKPLQPAQDLVLKPSDIVGVVTKSFVEDKTFIRAVEVPATVNKSGFQGRETLQFNQTNHPFTKTQGDSKADTRVGPELNPFQFRKGDPLANDQLARQISADLVPIRVTFRP